MHIALSLNAQQLIPIDNSLFIELVGVTEPPLAVIDINEIWSHLSDLGQVS
jgi:hypothetical protein